MKPLKTLKDHLEKTCIAPVAGIDEVGYGPWAGPLVAAAVILDLETLPPSLTTALDDSKKLTPLKRHQLYTALMDFQGNACWMGLGIASVQEIDQKGLKNANLLAMARACNHLEKKPGSLLVDGRYGPDLGIPCLPVVRGDSLSVSMAAASIYAKVTRDRLMRDLAQQYPHYGWERNVGYGTRFHAEALHMYGITPHHRRSYAPIKALLTVSSENLGTGSH